MYSESPITNAKVASAEFPAICKEVSYWTGHDGKTYVVAKLSGDALFNEHERLKGLGASTTAMPWLHKNVSLTLSLPST
jgi:hypothetical protein